MPELSGSSANFLFRLQALYLFLLISRETEICRANFPTSNSRWVRYWLNRSQFWMPSTCYHVNCSGHYNRNTCTIYLSVGSYPTTNHLHISLAFQWEEKAKHNLFEHCWKKYPSKNMIQSMELNKWILMHHKVPCCISDAEKLTKKAHWRIQILNLHSQH